MRWSEYLSKKALTFALISSCFWLVFILRFGSYHLTLDKGWADSVSHLYTSWIFWDHGLDVLRRPMKEFVLPLSKEEARKASAATDLTQGDFHKYRDLSGHDRTVFIVWPDVPRPYPPGLYVYTTPFSYLLYKGLLSLRQTLALMVWTWLFLAHLAIFSFSSKFFDSSREASIQEKIIPGLICLIAYFEFIRWSLNGQYDMIAVLLSISAALAYTERRHFTCLGLLSLSVFLHLRTIYLLPLGLFSFYELISHYRRDERLRLSPAQIMTFVCSTILVGLAVATLIWNGPYFKIDALYDLNNLHWTKFGVDNWSKTSCLVAGLTILFIYWFLEKQWILLTSSLCIALLFMQSRLIREWYVLFLFPILLLSIHQFKNRQRSIVAALAFYTLFATLFMKNSPFEFRFVKSIVNITSAPLDSTKVHLHTGNDARNVN